MSNACAHIERVVSLTQDGGSTMKSTPDSEIASSWHRCIGEYGLDPAQKHETLVLDRPDLQERQESLSVLMDIAHHQMETLYQQIAGTGYAIILTDREGVILDNIADRALNREFSQAGLWLGAVWTEQTEGTNGIGTCLVNKRPITVHQNEHFRPSNIGLTCSGAPIFDASGQLLAVLDASSARSRDSKQSQFHTEALVTLSAKMIENYHFLRRYRAEWVLRFHHRPEFIGAISEGMIAFDESGTVLAVNQSALNQLRYAARPLLIGASIESVFAIRFDTLMARSSTYPSTVWPASDHSGQHYYAMLLGPQGRFSTLTPARRAEPQTKTTALLSLESSSLRRLNTGDPSVAYNIRCAERVLDKDISILLHGETGTGKEVFARAIHAASSRAKQAFVAINCGAIPEQLIESELFGYKDGAFTGARRGGMRGKIEQANGGTLFLDEIGDMPPHLQTRLLRVLEERQVTPLGGDKALPVDVQIISASHRDLEQLMRDGGFREDLYYRLNGIALRLPPLRERTDFHALVTRVLESEAEAAASRICPEAFAALRGYSWPGNLRQLKNVIRTALALCDEDKIGLHDLPPAIQSCSTPACSTLQTEQSQYAEHDSNVAPDQVFAAESRVLLAEADELTKSVPPDNTPANALAGAERDALLNVLKVHDWNITNAATQLGISRNTLYRKMRKHGLEPKQFRWKKSI